MAKHLEAKINYDLYDKQILRTIEAHTEGEYCRVSIDCPDVPGSTMIEKKHYLEEHYDYLRTMLMFEPRGHHDMFGSFLCEPVNPEADFGVFFLDGGGYLNMCGHCTIGSVTAILEGGLMEMKEPETEVVLEAPAGIVRTVAQCKDGKVTGVTLTNVPAFVYKRDQVVNYNGKDVVFDICFGGSFFALVDTEKNFGLKVGVDTAKFLTEWSSFALQEINKQIPIQHPTLDITSVDLIENYSTTDTPGADLRNLVVFGNPANPQLDRSPCGTGTSAKLSLLYANGELKIGDKFVYESFIKTKFIGEVKETTKVGEFDAVVPMVTGAAYLCGEAKWFMDPDDVMAKGFEV
ncbi:MAG: proline racemase [Clostridiales bacterium]|nr:proline racemase [Clostridiales bacterium]